MGVRGGGDDGHRHGVRPTAKPAFEGRHMSRSLRVHGSNRRASVAGGVSVPGFAVWDDRSARAGPGFRVSARLFEDPTRVRPASARSYPQRGPIQVPPRRALESGARLGNGRCRSSVASLPPPPAGSVGDQGPPECDSGAHIMAARFFLHPGLLGERTSFHPWGSRIRLAVGGPCHGCRWRTDYFRRTVRFRPPMPSAAEQGRG